MAGRDKFSIEDAFQFDDDDSSLKVYSSTTENIPLTPTREVVSGEHGRLANSANSTVPVTELLSPSFPLSPVTPFVELVDNVMLSLSVTPSSCTSHHWKSGCECDSV